MTEPTNNKEKKNDALGDPADAVGESKFCRCFGYISTSECM